MGDFTSRSEKHGTISDSIERIRISRVLVSEIIRNWLPPSHRSRNAINETRIKKKKTERNGRIKLAGYIYIYIYTPVCIFRFDDGDNSLFFSVATKNPKRKTPNKFSLRRVTVFLRLIFNYSICRGPYLSRPGRSTLRPAPRC